MQSAARRTFPTGAEDAIFGPRRRMGTRRGAAGGETRRPPSHSPRLPSTVRLPARRDSSMRHAFPLGKPFRNGALECEGAIPFLSRLAPRTRGSPRMREFLPANGRRRRWIPGRTVCRTLNPLQAPRSRGLKRSRYHNAVCSFTRRKARGPGKTAQACFKGALV